MAGLCLKWLEEPVMVLTFLRRFLEAAVFCSCGLYIVRGILFICICLLSALVAGQLDFVVVGLFQAACVTW